MPKFFVDRQYFNGELVTILSEDAVHIKKVLRLSQKDIIMVCDGQGTDYRCELEEVGKTSVTARILDSAPNHSEPKLKLKLFQALPKGSKMELVIQKAVELGVHEIIPVVTKRTVVKLESKAAEQAKTARWQRIALEAAKQCGRGIVPQVHMPVEYDEAVKMLLQCGCGIMLYEKQEERDLKGIIQSCKGKDSIGVLVGPEGGFEPYEAERAADAGIVPVGLGSRILRTETAPIAIMAVIMYEFGEI